MMYHGTTTEDRGIFQLVRAIQVLRERDENVGLMLLGWALT